MVAEDIPSLRNACLVVAHPDDEVLWFSAVVSRVARVFICFLGNVHRAGLGRGRGAALDQDPLRDFVCLGLDEADVYDLARWPDPTPSPAGVALPKARDAATRRRYQENFTRLTQELAHRLAGYDTVFTHNPWGEYGHEEHVQVYRAVRQVQGQLGFRLWCSSYAATRSAGLLARCLHGAHVRALTLPTDTDFAQLAAARYREAGVWTWAKDYVWPQQEAFLHFLPAAGASPGLSPVPLQHLDLAPPPPALADHSLRALAQKLRRRLPLPLPHATPPL
jgi:LmbE family N-acetylglucosaminyl deacetylase